MVSITLISSAWLMPVRCSGTHRKLVNGKCHMVLVEESIMSKPGSMTRTSCGPKLVALYLQARNCLIVASTSINGLLGFKAS